ncbi:uncharacterized protein V1513DRAFT_449343 [Lipomyces chichibuensis]|uniref:uncharacterized protein n=1 Tax=Lipomyces chichibuensis TaxID=1546026 RepID=UPI00334352A5
MNCERLDIHCKGYVSILRWQDRTMQIAPVAETKYRSLRYVNIQSEHYRDYSDEIDTLLELYAPFDVLTDSMELIRPPLDIAASESDGFSTSSDSTSSTPLPHTPFGPPYSDPVLMTVEDYRTMQTLSSAAVRSRMTKTFALPSSTLPTVPSSPVSDDGYSPCTSGSFSSPLWENQHLYTSQPESLDTVFRGIGLPDTYLDFSEIVPQKTHSHDLYGLERTLPRDFGSGGHLVDVFYGD